MIERAVERERSQGWVKMEEASFVVVRPRDNVVLLDGEGVNSVKGLEVSEVR